MVKYLLLCHPLLPTPIDTIMQCCLEKFTKRENFIRAFWIALDFISELEERVQKQKRTKTLRLLQFGIKNFVKEQLKQKPENDAVRISPLEYCPEILFNIIVIKNVALDYADKLIDITSASMRSTLYDQLHSMVCRSMKMFIANTNSEKIIIKSCNLLEKLRFYLETEQDQFNLEIQELLLSKQDIMTEASTPLLKNIENRLSASKSHRSGDENGSNGSHDELPEQKDEKIKEEFINGLEEWLCCKGVPLIQKNAVVAEAFKLPDNLELMLALVMDPQMYPLKDCWAREFPDLVKVEKKEENSDSKAEDNPNPKKKNIEAIRTASYNIRGQKIVEMLTHRPNHAFLIRANNFAIENFFNMLYECINRDEIENNLNHLLKISDFYLKFDQDYTANYIMHYNMPFRILHHLEFERASQFLLTFLNVAELSLSGANLMRVFHYIRYTEFFLDIVRAIFKGAPGIDTNKTDLRFKPKQISIYLQGALNPDQYPAEVSNKKQKKKVEPLAEEKDDGSNLDIDRIASILKNKPEFNAKQWVDESRKKLIAAKQQTEKIRETKRSVDLAARYHSLRLAERSKFSKSTSVTEHQKLSFETSQQSGERSPVLQTTVRSPLNSPRQATLRRTTASSFAFAMANTPSKPTEDRQLGTRKGSFLKKADGEQSSKQESENVSMDRDRVYTEQDSNRKKFFGRIDKTPTKEVGNQTKRITPFYVDESYENTAIEDLCGLYPMKVAALVETELDKQAKSKEFTPKAILTDDKYALMLCDFLNLIVDRALSVRGTVLSDSLNPERRDFTRLWWAMFEPESGQFFRLLMKNYLLKIKVHHISEINTGYETGVILNTMLRNLDTEPLNLYGKALHSICREYFDFLVKTIIHSHAWLKRKDFTVYVQDFQITETLGSGRLLLVETLYLIIKNDVKEKYSIIRSVSDTCWHTLIIWLFEYKHNNMFQSLMLKIFDIVFFNADEKVILTIIYKMNLLPKIHNYFDQVLQNGIVNKADRTEEIIFCMKRILQTLSRAIESRKALSQLKIQISTNHSWKTIFKKHIDPKPIVTISKKNLEDIAVSPMIPKKDVLSPGQLPSVKSPKNPSLFRFDNLSPVAHSTNPISKNFFPAEIKLPLIQPSSTKAKAKPKGSLTTRERKSSRDL